MNDLEWNGDGFEWSGDAPSEDVPHAEEQPAEPQTAAPTPAEEPRESGFYAWSGSPQPPQAPGPRQKESPFANSPYVMAKQPEPQKTPWTGSYSATAETAQPRRETPAAPAGQPRPSKPQKRPLLPLMALLVGISSLVVAGALIWGMYSGFADLRQKLNNSAVRIEQLEDQLSAVQSPSTPQFGTATNDMPVRVPSAEGLLTPAQVYAQCVPSVVAINCSGTGYNNFGQVVETGSSGSGFILTEDGYIVTNYHVVEGSKTIEISMYDGTTYSAEYIGGNESNDIALIKVDAKNLPPVAIGSSSDLIVGDQVAAIGNPLGELASTLTVGYVSAKDRIVTSEGTQINMLQTDAAINPGNSGGPLFNMYGEVVGITSAKYSGTTNSGATIEGIGFAIPTDDVIMMLEDLRNFGYVTGGYLGVTVSEVDQETTELYGLPQGVLVRDVMPGSCAEKAGMRSRDIIINLGGYEVKNMNNLSRALNKCKAGQEVIVTVYRSGREVDLTVVLDERPQEEAPQATEPVTQPNNSWSGGGYFDDWFGQFFG